MGRYGIVDDSTGLYHARARYFSPQLGRFLSKDPVTGADNDGQSLNRYVYALNNPLCKVDITGQFSLSTSWASLVQLGGSVGYLALGLGEAAVTGIAFTGSDNVLVLGSGFASSVQTINKAFKSIDASAQNLVGAFRNQPSVSIAQGAGPFDSFFAIPKVKTLLQVNDLVSIANVFDAPGKIPDAYKALVTYRKILSGDTKGLAGLQAFDGLKSIFDSINQLRQLSEPPNSQREQSIEYAWTHNLPTLIELLEAQHAEIGPLKK